MDTIQSSTVPGLSAIGADDAFADASSLHAISSPSSTSQPLLPILSTNAYAVPPHRHQVTMPIDLTTLSKLIFFRQSMLHDYMTCPQMAAYRWIMGLQQQQSQFFSAFLGTAGHEVLYLMHQQRKFNYEWLELLELFEIAFRKAVNASESPPTLGKNYRTIDEQFAAECDDYIVMLDGYQRDPRNHSIYSVMQEQPFVLEVESDCSGTDTKYLFTGCMDMGYYTQSGAFNIRDYKFRMNAFKPNKTQLDLEPQFTLYALAAVKGSPACEVCRPRYEGGDLTGFDAHNTSDKQIVYNGPCSACAAKIDGKRWPRRYASQCDLLWMRDYKRHDKDQYDQYIPDRTLPKIKGGKRGTSLVLQRVLNPEYGTGYKKGDYVGKCIYPTFRDPNLLDTLLTDILRVCDSIRRGEIYRRPSEACAFWCKFREPCLAEVKISVNERYMVEAEAFTSSDLE